MINFKVKEIHYNDGYIIVEDYEMKQNIYINGKPISKKWFDSIESFHEGFAKVKVNDKYNLIDMNGKYAIKKWFDDIYYFSDGWALIKNRNNKWNFIDIKGNLISNKWFDNAYDFHCGRALVTIDGKDNFIDINGELISKDGYKSAFSFHCGYARIIKNKKYEFIDTKGMQLCDELFDDAYDFTEGYARVKNNNKWNFIDTKGKIICKEWFDNIDDFNCGYAKVQKDGKCYFIDTQGKIISDDSYVIIGNFYNGYAKVKLNDKFNFIDKTGKLISDKWFRDAYDFYEGLAIVKDNGLCYYIDTDGKQKGNFEFELVGNDIDSFNKYFCSYDVNKGKSKIDLDLIRIDSKYNYFNRKNANLVFDNVFDSIETLSIHLMKKMKNMPVRLEKNSDSITVAYTDPVYKEIAKILYAINSDKFSNDNKARILSEVTTIKDGYNNEASGVLTGKTSALLEIKNKYMRKLALIELEVMKKDKKALKKIESKKMEKLITSGNISGNNDDDRKFKDPVYGYMASIIKLLDNELISEELRNEKLREIEKIYSEYQKYFNEFSDNKNDTILLSLDNYNKIKEDVIKKLSIIEYEINEIIKKLKISAAYEEETQMIADMIKKFKM